MRKMSKMCYKVKTTETKATKHSTATSTQRLLLCESGGQCGIDINNAISTTKSTIKKESAGKNITSDDTSIIRPAKITSKDIFLSDNNNGTKTARDTSGRKVPSDGSTSNVKRTTKIFSTRVKVSQGDNTSIKTTKGTLFGDTISDIDHNRNTVRAAKTTGSTPPGKKLSSDHRNTIKTARLNTDIVTQNNSNSTNSTSRETFGKKISDIGAKTIDRTATKSTRGNKFGKKASSDNDNLRNANTFCKHKRISLFSSTSEDADDDMLDEVEEEEDDDDDEISRLRPLPLWMQEAQNNLM